MSFFEKGFTQLGEWMASVASSEYTKILWESRQGITTGIILFIVGSWILKAMVD